MLLGIAAAALADDCPPPADSVRLMMQDPAVLDGRLAFLAKTGDGADGRIAALRKLFEAAGCPQLAEGSEVGAHNLECDVPGSASGAGTIVVGTSQAYDSVATLALLPSLMEALAAAPRKHTFRWAAFSAHKEKRPKGAMRFLDAVPHDTLHAMVHLGPLGFGPLRIHVGRPNEALGCLLSAAARRAGTRIDSSARDFAMCRQRRGMNPVSAGRSDGQFEFDCSPHIQDRVGNDWRPFQAAGVRTFGMSSSDATRPVLPLDPEQYVRSERAVAMFLALADDALAAPATSSPR
jgi:hypothetical protein